MFTPGSVSLLREVYNWTIADLNINDLDDQKYTLCKKLSEVSANFENCNDMLTRTVSQQSRTIH